MSTESTTLQQLREKIVTYLDQREIRYTRDEAGNYTFQHGTTLVFIQPMEWQNYTLVKVLAPIAVDITAANEALAFFLAELNANLLFGKFSLDVPRRSIWLEHSLLGDYLDLEELMVTLEVIAFVADEYDEEISKTAGGKRAIDIK